MGFHRGEIKRAVVKSYTALLDAESKYRRYPEQEMVVFARNTPFRELVDVVIPDRYGKTLSENPLVIIGTDHSTTVGVDVIVKGTLQFLEEENHGNRYDILSVQGGMNGDKISVIYMLRPYDGSFGPDPKDLFNYFGEKKMKEEKKDASMTGFAAPKPDKAAEGDPFSEFTKQYRDVDYNKPFLGSDYRPIYRDTGSEADPMYRIHSDCTKDLLHGTGEQFNRLFRRAVAYFSSQEKNSLIEVLHMDDRDRRLRSTFSEKIERYLKINFVDTGLMPVEDTAVMKRRIENALFDLYLVQDLISDNADITDIKITAPDSVRVRIRGKSYLSDVCFIDDADYLRFVHGLAVRNRIDLSIPVQTFTDVKDPDYILRFTLTSGYVTGTGYPALHIRKISRVKKSSDELIRDGLLTPFLRDYLIDCSRYSKGIVIAGPPGSGKTTLLNWLIEYGYEDTAEVLCIQESDELFSNRKGIMFEHVILNPKPGETACSLEDLGKLGLVSGCDVFIIGETKSGEICSAITLSNSGCRTAMTVHSPSAEETVEKMIDLMLRGYADSYETAKRMIRSFQTIVYVKDFRIQEITEIAGYDEEKKDIRYRAVYRC